MDVALFNACSTGGSNAEVRRILLELSSSSSSSATAAADPVFLCRASECGRRGAVRALLESGAAASAPHPSGITPLLLAATNGRASVVRTLLAAGANPNARRADGTPVLHIAAKGGYVSIVGLLLDAGADPGATDPVMRVTALQTVGAFAFASVGMAAVVQILKGAAAARPAPPLMRGAGLPFIVKASTRGGEGGLGVFAARDLLRGEVLETCETIPLSLAKWQAHGVRTVLRHYCYRCPRTKGYLICLGTGSLFNHSNKPNLQWSIGADERITFSIPFTVARVAEGEELCHFYGHEVSFPYTPSEASADSETSTEEEDTSEEEEEEGGGGGGGGSLR